MTKMVSKTGALFDSRLTELKAVDVARLERKAAEASSLLKALANDRRLMILCCLALGEQSVGEIEKQVGLGQSSLSQHLAVLRRKGLVATRRESRTIHYRLASREVEAIMLVLYELYCRDEGKSGSEGPEPDRTE